LHLSGLRLCNVSPTSWSVVVRSCGIPHLGSLGLVTMFRWVCVLILLISAEPVAFV
jgi:hypothetical protein